MNNALLENTTHIENQKLSPIKTPHLKVVEETQKNTSSTNKGNCLNKRLTNGKQKVNKTSLKPWLNADGTRKSDKEISTLGQNWTPKMWKEYLDSEVGVINEEDDKLNFFHDMDTGAVYERQEVLDLIQSVEENGELEIALLIAILELSKLEREVIKYSYWRYDTHEEIAKQLKTTTDSIKVLKGRATKKLGEILPSKEFSKKLKRLEKSGKLKKLIVKQKQWLSSK